MNQQVVTGSLADGGSYRATSYMVELTDGTGAVHQTVDMNDIKSIQRRGTRLTIKRRQGSDLTLDAASLDDAGRLETLLRVSTAQPAPAARQRGGLARKLMIGCGGLIVVLVVLGVIIAIAESVLAPSGGHALRGAEGAVREC